MKEESARMNQVVQGWKLKHRLKNMDSHKLCWKLMDSSVDIYMEK